MVGTGLALQNGLGGAIPIAAGATTFTIAAVLTVAIGVGMHAGYNAAQRLYVLRGYVPDGRGLTYGDRYVGEYEDVKLEVRADNRGRNNNSISLICRYNADIGWYEFNIANNGLYDILYAEVENDGDISYSRVANGGSNAINQGMDVNEYAITCDDEELGLFINGDEVITIPERRYGLRSGQVGVSVSSFNVLPILIEMDWIRISEP